MKLLDDDIKPSFGKGINKIDSDDDDDPDDVKSPPTSLEPPITQSKSDEPVCAADLLTHGDSDLFFVQLPDHLPSVIPDSSDTKLCNLDRLQEGVAGKLVIRESGRCQLVLGDHLLSVNLGTKVGFLQDAVSIEVGEDGEGDMTLLGHVSHRLIVTPDWADMMDKSGLSSSLA